MQYVEYDKNKIQSFEIETTAISNKEIIGTCELGTAEIQLLNDSNEYSNFKNKWIRTPQGSFYIHEVVPVQEKVNIKLSCYDIKYLLDVKYDKSKYEDIFPCSIAEWRNKMAEDLGIIFYDNDIFPNANFVLNEHPFIGNDVSYRDVMKQIAQACASFIITDENDKFYFAWFDFSVQFFIDDWLELTTEKESTKEINTIVLGRGDAEDIVMWPYPKVENPVEFRIDNNYILDPQDVDNDRRYDVIEPIYNRINGFKYVVFNMRTQSAENVFDIKLGSSVKYVDIWDNEIESVVMSKKIVFLGDDLDNPENYELIISAEEINESSSEYSYAKTVEQIAKDAQIAADKVNAKVTLLTNEVREYDEKYAKIEMDVNGISQKVEATYDFTREVNGRNKFRVNEIQKNGLLELRIKGIINNPIVSSNTYVSDNTLVKSVYLVIKDEARIRLPINYLEEDDEFVWKLVYNEEKEVYTPEVKISRGNNVFESLESFDIPISKGNHIFYIENYPLLNVYIKYAIINEITDEFAIKKTLISEINQSAEGIQIKGDKISLEGKKINLTSEDIEINSNNFKVDKTGKIIATAGEIGGFSINENFNNHFSGNYVYSFYDLMLIKSYLLGHIDLDSTTFSILDLNNDSQLTLPDLTLIQSYVLNSNNLVNKVIEGFLEINSSDPRNCLTIKDSSDNNVVQIGIGGVGATNGIFRNIVCSDDRSTSDNQLVSINGPQGKIYATGTISQGSQEKLKKNFEKFSNALKVIDEIDIYKYNLKNEKDDDKKHIGFVIGEDYKYSKEITTTNPSGEDSGVDLYSMTSLCLQAIKELKDEVKILKREIKLLKGVD